MLERTKGSGAPVRRRGFTLVELLVVVSIIALLIAILLPSLKRARENAKRIKCGANIRAIAQAALTYAADDPKEATIPIGEADELYPESYFCFYGWGGRGGKDDQPAPYTTSIWSGGNRMSANDRPLNHVLYKGGMKTKGGGLAGWRADCELDLELYNCPGDKTFPGMHLLGYKRSNRSSYDCFGTSYTANCFLVGVGGLGTSLSSNSMYRRPMSRVPNPANTLMYYENAARYAAYANNSIANGGEYEQTDCFWPYAYGAFTAKGYHGQDFHFNAAFGDGHAAYVKIKGHGLVHYAEGVVAATNRCILHRGIGYQWDTLPAALVPTHKKRYGDIEGHTDSPRPDTSGGGSGDYWDVVDK